MASQTRGEVENLIASFKEEETPSCCIPEAQGIRIIGVISCVSGLFISCLSLLCMQLHGDELHGNGLVIKRYLLGVGLSSALVSIWLLWKEGCTTAAKIWTVIHVLCAVVSIIMFCQLLIQNTDFERLMQVLLSLAGLNLCIMIFNCLIMIEFLMHPGASKDS